MFHWLCLFIAGLYLWLYPSILLVPDEYRKGFWSADYNVTRRGIVASREIYEVKSYFRQLNVYRVTILTNGKNEHFWVANSAVFRGLPPGDLTSFETRGKVVVLAHPIGNHPPIVSLLN